VEDDPVLGGTLVHRLELEGYRPFWWQTGREALEALGSTRPHVVVCDIRLPDMDGEEIYQQIPLSVADDTPFLFVTAFGQIDQAVRLTKAGAVDYIVKPYALAVLLQRIEALISLQPEAAGVLGRSKAMCEVELLLRRVAHLDSTLLFTGESGVGKEVAAHFVHEISTRADEPFIAVNCAAIPSELIESQLFGHEKGAFTGAQARHHGYVERARNGILFLDEIGELPLLMQAKLLRVIETRAFTRVGGETVYRMGARILCATNAKLEAAVSGGRFRQDLYYRINVISVEISPLRHRPEDILQLAHQFMREFSKAFRRDVVGFTPAAEQRMLEYSWPGNVRELRNRIERAVVLSQAPRISVDLVFPSESAELASGPFRTLAEIRDRAERYHIRAVLAGADGRIDETAKLLGVSRSTLFEKMRRLDIRSEA
jgi:DNA-binding NtrC family response regulator